MDDNHNELNERLLKHDFKHETALNAHYKEAKVVARHYAQAEDALPKYGDCRNSREPIGLACLKMMINNYCQAKGNGATLLLKRSITIDMKAIFLTAARR